MNNRLSFDAWMEHVLKESSLLEARGAFENFEAEEIQPLVFDTPEKTFQFLKKAFAYSILSEDFFLEKWEEELRRAIFSPFVKAHPLSRALAFFLGSKLNISQPPLVPMHPLMPLHESCQLALLWKLAKEEEGAHRLAGKILPLVSLPSLWCKESEYKEEEMQLSIDLFCRAFGHKVKAPDCRVDPYFLALAKSQIEFPQVLQSHKVADLGLGLSFQRNESYTAALALAGEATPLGVFHAKGIQVRAFGPQSRPLTEAAKFGVTRLPDSQPMEHWTAMEALSEVWIEIKPQFEKDSLAVSARFLGLRVETPVSFSFYVKAPFCTIEGKNYFPKKLERYTGEAKPVFFGNSLRIANALQGKMEIIPLAGEGSFWDADFLLAFEINPFEAKGEYTLSV